ncbi:MAG TPA: GatB/YqeY domain-containing protein [Candidatus Saccharimonadales bacterium]|jgi:hypothetical protein|nr:GatB/YqeY domain-containing protein [Candidatus Saccharimonadales bacterium]
MLKGRIDADLKTAMLGGDKFLTEVLRGLKSAILYKEVALKKRDEGLSDAEIEQLFASEAKKRDESAALFEQGGNQESADKERREKEIILGYLPTQLSEGDIAVIVDEEVQKLGENGPQAMGKVIGAVKSRTGSTADGAIIARIVKTKLGV